MWELLKTIVLLIVRKATDLLTTIGGMPNPEYNAFCPDDCGELSCPRSATMSHSVVVDRTTNLPIERWTLYQWTKLRKY